MSDDKYKNRSELVQFNIVEVKRATKRKAATIKPNHCCDKYEINGEELLMFDEKEVLGVCE